MLEDGFDTKGLYRKILDCGHHMLDSYGIPDSILTEDGLIGVEVVQWSDVEVAGEYYLSRPVIRDVNYPEYLMFSDKSSYPNGDVVERIYTFYNDSGHSLQQTPEPIYDLKDGMTLHDYLSGIFEQFGLSHFNDELDFLLYKMEKGSSIISGSHQN